MARYLITGGSGFVGRSLARVIEAADHEAIVATRGRHHEGDIHHWVEYDLRDRATIANILEVKPDGIFHLAWSTTPGSAESDPASDVQINLGGTLALFSELAKSMPVPIVFVSSGGTVYGPAEYLPLKENHPLRPIGVYGITKATAERYATNLRERYGLDVRIARLSNPFGALQSTAKMQGAASIFARKIVHREPITIWGDGSNIRDYIDVDDASAALLEIMRLRRQHASQHQIYNVGSGEGYSLSQLLDTLSELTGLKADVSYSNERNFDIAANVLDIGKIQQETGWKPKPTVEAMRLMVDALLKT